MGCCHISQVFVFGTDNIESFHFNFSDEAKRNLKGQYKIGLDSSVTSMEDFTEKNKINLFVLAAEGSGNCLILSASSVEEKNFWISRIAEYIEHVRSSVF